MERAMIAYLLLTYKKLILQKVFNITANKWD